MWENEKLLIMSNFSFSYSVFKRRVLQTRKNQGLFGKGLKPLLLSHTFIVKTMVSNMRGIYTVTMTIISPRTEIGRIADRTSDPLLSVPLKYRPSYRGSAEHKWCMACSRVNCSWLVVLSFKATLTANVISWRSVTHMCFLAF